MFRHVLGSPTRPRHSAVGFLRRFWVPMALVLWVGGLGVGLEALWSYAYTPGPAAEAPRQFPRQRGVTLDGTRPTMLMFLHPQCSCSQASVHELQVLLSRAPGRIAVRAVMARDPVPGSGAGVSLRAQAEALPDVEVISDERGDAARAFGARVSGQVLVYDTSGALAFAGGITSARGHEGDNDGLDLAVAIALGRRPTGRQTPVFGCLLSEASGPPTPGGPS